MRTVKSLLQRCHIVDNKTPKSRGVRVGVGVQVGVGAGTNALLTAFERCHLLGSPGLTRLEN